MEMACGEKHTFWLKVSFCGHRMSVVRLSIVRHLVSVNNFLKQYILTTCRISNFTGIILDGSLLFKDFNFMQNSGSHGNQKENKILSKTTGAHLKIICHKWSLGDPLPRLFKLYRSIEKHGCHGSVSHKPWIRIDALLVKMIISI